MGAQANGDNGTSNEQAGPDELANVTPTAVSEPSDAFAAAAAKAGLPRPPKSTAALPEAKRQKQ